MLHVRQADYDFFRCIADKCPADCCSGWEIYIDDDSLARYESLPGATGDYLRDSIDYKNQIFKQKDRRCALLDESGLCRLQSAFGEEALCETCRMFPRHVEEFDGVREYSLSLSCPVVARQTLTSQTPLSLLTKEDETPDDFDEFDDLLFDKLLYARDKIFEICHDRELPLRRRLDLILFGAAKMQEYLDEDRIFEMDSLWEDMDALEVPEETFEESRRLYNGLYALERLDRSFTRVLDRTWNVMFDAGEESPWDESLDFSRYSDGEALSIAGEQILSSLIYVYFCGGVYDDLIYAKAAFAVYMVRWLFLFLKTAVLDEPDSDPMETLITITWRFCRETENSDRNLQLLEDILLS